MALERTFGIIKPDAVAAGAIGGAIDIIEKSHLKVIGLRYLTMSQKQAEGFYAVHKARPFFNDLVKFMTSGPCVVMALEGENAVAKYREIMGSTDSKKAAPGTIRAKYGTDIEKNAVHGSDSLENAKIELAYFFQSSELG
jgi:nucleoside-diphosphate kinase